MFKLSSGRLKTEIANEKKVKNVNYGLNRNFWFVHQYLHRKGNYGQNLANQIS